MFERFTDRARQVVVDAQEEARSRNHNYVGTEHLLLALIRQRDGLAAEALASLGVRPERLSQLVDEIIGTGPEPPTARILFTPRARTVLEHSLRESLQSGVGHVGPEHILLGLIREGEGVAAQVLLRQGLDLTTARGRVGPIPPVPTAADAAARAVRREQTPDELIVSTGIDMVRYTDRARKTIVLARDEAMMLNHNYLGTEHLLLGLLHEGEGVAAKALGSLGITLEAARQPVEKILGRGAQPSPAYLPLTPRAKKVYARSQREALQLGHNYIGTEHLLLGLIYEHDSVAAQVIIGLGADLQRVRQHVIMLLHGYPPGQVTTAPRAPAVRPAQARPGKTLTEVVRLAEAEAVGLGHGYVGTEHLLLGLLTAEGAAEEIAGSLLDAVTADSARALIVGLAGTGGSGADRIGFTPEALDVLNLAACEALTRNEEEAGAGHLMVALAWASGSLARCVMRELGMFDRASGLTEAAAGGPVAGGSG